MRHDNNLLAQLGRAHRFRSAAALSLLSLSLLTLEVNASPNSTAMKVHSRIAGVPPTPEALAAMAERITDNDTAGAAMIAMENDNFYNVTLKNWITPWTTEARSVFEPLNDYTATVIGIIRDDKDFRTVLTDNILYVASPASGSFPVYEGLDNDHYEAVQMSGVSLKDALVETTQSSTLPDFPEEAAAGVLTTRAAAKAFFVDGTNRAMYRFTQINYLCRDLESTHDATKPVNRVRQDVDRSPAERPDAYINECAGCHSGLDALSGAYAHYDYNVPASVVIPVGDRFFVPPLSIVYTPDRIAKKYSNNFTVFSEGFATVDDSWINYWRTGRNSRIGWDENLPGKGNGMRSLGEELANTEAFARCQVEKAFELVCLTEPQTGSDKSTVSEITEKFKTSNYKIKTAISHIAAYCVGE